MKHLSDFAIYVGSLIEMYFFQKLFDIYAIFLRLAFVFGQKSPPSSSQGWALQVGCVGSKSEKLTFQVQWKRKMEKDC